MDILGIVGFVFGLMGFVVATGVTFQVAKLEAQLKARGILDGKKGT